MSKEYLTQAELQHIEHVNKVLNDHLELVNAVTSLTEEKIATLITAYRGYVRELATIQKEMGEVVQNIYRSGREIGHATGKTNEIMAFYDQVNKLDKLLTPELMEKLKRLTNG
jgi:vacuolar-type H+-ATPase subunit D/Vma8